MGLEEARWGVVKLQVLFHKIHAIQRARWGKGEEETLRSSGPQVGKLKFLPHSTR